ncbi:MAG: hypothetical protein JSV89_07345 [Spirochaetaceae bacterium]|nr:MAG: hypothetical protein JSV89_07345 [Spirochaetaceae bacterium]
MKLKRPMIVTFILLLLTVLAAVVLSSCVTTGGAECSEEGQILWEKDSNPERDAPRWVDNRKAALREAGVRASEIPNRYVVYMGRSEDKADERAARFDAVEDMLKRYAVYLQGELDRILPEAADRAGVRLPQLNTALGADMAVSYLPREPIEANVIRAHWTATGKLCPDLTQTVYRIYVLGAFDKDARREHVREAAIETFKYAIIRGEDKDKVLEEAQRLIRRL